MLYAKIMHLSVSIFLCAFAGAFDAAGGDGEYKFCDSFTHFEHINQLFEIIWPVSWRGMSPDFSDGFCSHGVVWSLFFAWAIAQIWASISGKMEIFDMILELQPNCCCWACSVVGFYWWILIYPDGMRQGICTNKILWSHLFYFLSEVLQISLVWYCLRKKTSSRFRTQSPSASLFTEQSKSSVGRECGYGVFYYFVLKGRLPLSVHQPMRSLLP